LEVVAPCEGGGEQVIIGKHTGLDCLTDANARLIAAAPGLFDGANKVFDAVDFHDADMVEAAINDLRVVVARITHTEGRETT